MTCNQTDVFENYIASIFRFVEYFEKATLVSNRIELLPDNNNNVAWSIAWSI
jgi:hypothetical protein